MTDWQVTLQRLSALTVKARRAPARVPKGQRRGRAKGGQFAPAARADDASPALQRWEETHRGRKNESGALFLDGDLFLDWKGTAHHLPPPPARLMNHRLFTMTHTHTGTEYGLSLFDLEQGLGDGYKEIRAVEADGTISSLRPRRRLSPRRIENICNDYYMAWQLEDLMGSPNAALRAMAATARQYPRDLDYAVFAPHPRKRR